MQSLYDLAEDEIVATTKVSDSTVTLYKEKCKNCAGTGIWVASNRSFTGQCFSCKGVGFHEFKTSATEREKNRNSYSQSKERKEATAVHNFQKEFPTEYNWMMKSHATFEFAQSMYDSVKKYGSLTERQLAAVQNCVAKELARTAQKVEKDSLAPSVSVEAIEVAFNKAQSAGIQRPKLRLDTFTFSPAPASGQNAGALYVKEGDQYLGKVLRGKFFGSRDCTDEVQGRIIAVASDPANAAIAYGKKYGSCAVCARTLSDPVSVERGIGPICAGRYGW